MNLKLWMPKYIRKHYLTLKSTKNMIEIGQIDSAIGERKSCEIMIFRVFSFKKKKKIFKFKSLYSTKTINSL